jgi:hypothetical protein
MAKSKIEKIVMILGIAALPIGATFIIKGCQKKPVENPAVTRLETINDSLFKVIDKNTKAANELYLKLDSLNFRSDTIIERQYTVNKYYKDEIYNILNSDDKILFLDIRLVEVRKVKFITRHNLIDKSRPYFVNNLFFFIICFIS